MRLLYLTALLAFVVCLLVNAFVDAFLVERIAILGSFVGLQYSKNAGVAFGVRLPSTMQAILIGLAAMGVLFVALRSARTTLHQIGFGLILGGALANIVDRLRDGFVTDYVQVGTFPIFNVADACITVGAMLLIGEGLGLGRNKKRAKHGLSQT